jgi:hypothetical protein
VPRARRVEGPDRHEQEEALGVRDPEEERPREQREQDHHREGVLAPELELDEPVQEVQGAAERRQRHRERSEELELGRGSEAGSDPCQQRVEREERDRVVGHLLAGRRVPVVDDREVPDRVPVSQGREERVADRAERPREQPGVRVRAVLLVDRAGYLRGDEGSAEHQRPRHDEHAERLPHGRAAPAGRSGRAHAGRRRSRAAIAHAPIAAAAAISGVGGTV